MKNKRIAMLVLSAMIVVSSYPGAISHAADAENIIENESGQEKDGFAALTTETVEENAVKTEGEDNRLGMDRSEGEGEAESATESNPDENSTKIESATDKNAENHITVQSDSQTQMDGITVETGDDGTLTVTSDGVESAMPGLMDASKVVYHEVDGSQEVESRTWDVPINIVMKNCETTTASGGNDSLGGMEILDVIKGPITYIFNQPVNITVDGGSASAMSLIRSNMTSNYSKWIFNAPVTFTIKNGEFSYINGMQVLNGYNYFTEKGKNWGVEMNDTYTMTVDNCTDVTAINAAGKKNRERTWSSNNGRVDDFSCGFKKGLTLNVKDTEVSDSIVPGHILKQSGKDGGPDEQYRYWAEGDVVVNLDNVQVEDFASSQSSKLMAGKTDLDGNLTVNLTNGSTINTFFGENVPFGKPSASILVGNVTGTSRLNMTSGATMEALAGLEELTLAGAIQITALFTLPDAGMKVYVSKDAKWNNGDVLLSYKYLTNSEYVKVDETKVISDWDDPNLELKYQDLTAESTQQWYLNKDVTVTFDSDGGTNVDSQTVRQGSAVAEPTPAPTKANSIFEGWYTDKTYAIKWTFTDPVNQDMTLYAKWRTETANVKVSEKDGSKEYGTVTVEKGSPVTSEKLPTVEKTGYTVEKWITSDGQDWDIENDNVTADIEIHPVWKLNAPEATLTAEGNITTVHIGDTVKLIAEAAHEAGNSITYQFEWYKDGEVLKLNKTRAAEIAREDDKSSELLVDESGEYSVKVIATDGTLSSEAEAGPILVEVTPHQFGDDWKYDTKDHWHECTIENCGVKDQEEAHIFSEWTVVKPATSKEQGEKERSCTTCGYKETEKIPTTDNEAPVISAADKELTVGDKFEAKADVKATDKEDGNLTDKIEVIKNTVDTSKAGTYEVTYQVTDTDGATVTKTIKVVVKAKKTEDPKDDPKDNPKTDTDKADNTKKEITTVEIKVITTTTQAAKTGDGASAGFAFLGIVLGAVGIFEMLRRKRI